MSELLDFTENIDSSLGQKENPPVEGWVFVASEGFEPPKAEPSDLQSDPFGR